MFKKFLNCFVAIAVVVASVIVPTPMSNALTIKANAESTIIDTSISFPLKCTDITLVASQLGTMNRPNAHGTWKDNGVIKDVPLNISTGYNTVPHDGVNANNNGLPWGLSVIDITDNNRGNSIYGKEIYPMKSGEIYTVFSSATGSGNCVIIKNDDGTYASYNHMSEFGKGINKGDGIKNKGSGMRVTAGETVIGYVGKTGNATGPHLHCELTGVDLYCTFLAKGINIELGKNANSHNKTHPEYHKTAPIDVGAKDGDEVNIIDGWYNIEVSNGLRVDVKSDKYASNQNVWLWTQNNSNAQKFYIQKRSNGWYNIYSSNKNFVLDVYGNKAKDGANISLGKYNSGRSGQQFKFYKNRDGVVIKSKLNTKYQLDVSGAYKEELLKSECNIGLWTKTDDPYNPAQRFYLKSTLEPGSSNYTTVKNKAGANLNSGKNFNSYLLEMPYGAKVEVLEISGNYVKVNYTAVGWCSKNLLSISSDNKSATIKNKAGANLNSGKNFNSYMLEMPYGSAVSIQEISGNYVKVSYVVTGWCSKNLLSL